MKTHTHIVKEILSRYGYQSEFQPLHTQNDILKYDAKKDAVSSEKFLTFLTPTGRVVGRLFHIKSENDSLSKSDLKKIIDIFSPYRIPHVDEIISDLKSAS